MEYGYMGKIAWVNLSKRSIRLEDTKKYSQWVGGRGLASYLVFKNVPETTDPLSAENLVVISTGPLTGTLSPASGRLNISSKNALTNGYASANAGGYFAPELKMAGFDALIISGASKTPAYIYVSDDKIKILSAENLWGLKTSQCYHQIQKELKDEKIRIICIGPAGENKCKTASIVVDNGRSASYGGIGSVLGAKKLKAIAVRGSLSIGVWDSKGIAELSNIVMKKIATTKATKTFQKFGTLHTIPPGISGDECYVVKNYQDGIWDPQKTAKIGPKVFINHYKVKDLACFNCPLECSKLYRYSVEGGREKTFEGFQANHVTNFGSMVDNDDPNVILEASSLCNELGLDVDSVACALSWTFECFQKGIITPAECGGLDLSWGNKSSIIQLIKEMAYRKGVGRLIADGVFEASRKLGKGTGSWAMNIKGAPLREINMQTKMSWALGIGVSTRGSGHLNGSFRFDSIDKLTQKQVEMLGFRKRPKPDDAEVVGRTVAWFENFKALVDSLGLCYFTTWWAGGILGPDELAELYKFVTNSQKNTDELLNIGARIHNVEKAFNTIHAKFNRKDDFPPERLFEMHVSEGKNRGAVIERNFWESSLNEYYRARQYDNNSGFQTRECLRKLGLDDVEGRLRVAGKLIE